MYLVVSSSFAGGQGPPLSTTSFIMETLSASKRLDSKIMWSDVYVLRLPELQEIIQSVPRSKHSVFVIKKTYQLML